MLGTRAMMRTAAAVTGNAQGLSSLAVTLEKG